jgi:hypothetical protein
MRSCSSVNQNYLVLWDPDQSGCFDPYRWSLSAADALCTPSINEGAERWQTALLDIDNGDAEAKFALHILESLGVPVLAR